MTRNLVRLAFLSLLLSSCGAFERVKDKDPQPDPRVEELRTQTDARRAALEDKLEDGWLARTECDSTLWNGLACAAGVGVDIALAEYAPGEIHRRPAPSCWTREKGDQGARSTVSNDMLLGYELCLWRRRDLDAARRLASYGEGHDRGIGWQMGEPYPDELERVLLRPNGQGRLGTLIERLSDGADKRSYRLIPEVYGDVGADFEKHLRAVGIVLDGELDRIARLKVDEPVIRALAPLALIDIPRSAVDSIEELASDAPGDALFQAVRGIYSGDQMPAVTLLLDPAYQCPSYVRSDNQADAAVYCEIHKLFAADVVLRAFDGKD